MENPRYGNVLNNGLERSQRSPIKGEKGRDAERRQRSVTRSIPPSHIIGKTSPNSHIHKTFVPSGAEVLSFLSVSVHKVTTDGGLVYVLLQLYPIWI
jgi:hypothetical protein